MREKKPTLIITFDNTTQAIAVEKFCRAHALPGRIIPVPRLISASCGLSWKAEPAAKKALIDAFTEAGLTWAECHIIEL